MPGSPTSVTSEPCPSWAAARWAVRGASSFSRPTKMRLAFMSGEVQAPAGRRVVPQARRRRLLQDARRTHGRFGAVRFLAPDVEVQAPLGPLRDLLAYLAVGGERVVHPHHVH